jgi:acyl-CoA thioesterase
LHPFDADTRLEQTGADAYKTELSNRWSRLGGGPLGGYSLAVCIRALEAEVPHPDALSVSATFMRQAMVGSAEVSTSKIRVGSRFSTAQASLLQNEKELLRVVATFTDFDKLEGRTLMFNEAPPPSPPESAFEPFADDRGPLVDIADRIDYRTTEPVGWYSGRPAGKHEASFWMRFREERPHDAAALAFFCDAAAPIVLELGAIDSRTLDLGVHLRARAASGWLACRVCTRHVIGSFHEEDFEIWDSSGALVAQSRQLALLAGI